MKWSKKNTRDAQGRVAALAVFCTACCGRFCGRASAFWGGWHAVCGMGFHLTDAGQERPALGVCLYHSNGWYRKLAAKDRRGYLVPSQVCKFRSLHRFEEGTRYRVGCKNCYHRRVSSIGMLATVDMVE